MKSASIPELGLSAHRIIRALNDRLDGNEAFIVIVDQE